MASERTPPRPWRADRAAVEEELHLPVQRCRNRAIVPTVAGEFKDSALMMEFGKTGLGLFVAPTVVAETVRRQYGVVALGALREVRERFFVIATERRITHPAVLAITKGAHQTVFTG